MTAPASQTPEPAANSPRVWVQNYARAGLIGWLLRYYVFAALALIVAIGAGGVVVYRSFAEDLPSVEGIEAYRTTAPGITRIYAANGTLLSELAREHRAYARYEDIPQGLVHAFMAAEDRRFFTHEGLDWRGLARATVANLRSGTVLQGGSTITQQVAKGFLSDDRTLARKIREAILSLRLEARLPKSRIMEIYLNKIFLGHGAYGVGAAASRYFDKTLGELSLAECALVAGLAQAPSRYSPVSNPERALKRRSVVLQDMVEAGYITPGERDAADAEALNLAHSTDVFRLRAPYYAEHARLAVADTLGPEAVLQDGLQIETAVRLELQDHADKAVDRALRRMDRRQGWRGPVATLSTERGRGRLVERLKAEYGAQALSIEDRWYLAVVTAVKRREAQLDLGEVQARLPLRNMQWAALYDRNSMINDLKTDDVRDALEAGDVIWVQKDPRWEPPEEPPADGKPVLQDVRLGQVPRVEAALYTTDLETGYVVAMQGGHDYDRSQFNRTTQACRQPGSVFKAIYYALAIDTGDFNMGSILEDRPYEPEEGEEWNPVNIHGTIEGQVLLRTAFIKSLNLSSIKLFMKLGADRVVKFARVLGFTTELIADKALSLGASCVRIDELVRAFAILSTGGDAFEPVYVRRVTDKRGDLVVDNRHPWDGAMDVRGRIDRMAAPDVYAPKQLVDAQTSFIITRLMRDVVTNGIGARAQRIGVPAGGKSGTASKKENTTDTWFVGFTSRYATASWMGDDKYERSLGAEDASFTTATPMWTRYMTEVVKDVEHGPVPSFEVPGLVKTKVDARTGGVVIPGEPVATLFLRQ